MSAHQRDGSMGHGVCLEQKTRKVVLNFYGDRQFILFKKVLIFLFGCIRSLFATWGCHRGSRAQ